MRGGRGPQSQVRRPALGAVDHCADEHRHHGAHACWTRQAAGHPPSLLSSAGPADLTTEGGIPVTTVARTLVDLNAVVPDRLLERALEQAYIRRLLPVGAVEDALERANGRKTRALRRLIAAENRTATVTRSELEERFLTLLRSVELPDPEVNAWLCGYEVDFLWRARRRVIEVDGHAYHSTRRATTRDRRKDDELETAGYRVTRFTADQILHDSEDTLARTRRVLGSSQ